MKKTIALLLAVLMLLSVAACGDKTNNAAGPAEDRSESDAVQEAQPAAEQAPETNVPEQPEQLPSEEASEQTADAGLEDKSAQTEAPFGEAVSAEDSSVVSPPAPAEPEIPEPAFRNPLTGEGCTEEQYLMRPYALVFNYASEAVAKVQTGLYRADVILEMYTESYTTRLLAYYKDIDGIGQMGTLRSSRIDFARMANAYDSIFVHVGGDPTYGAEYIRKHNMKTANFNLYYNDDEGHVFWFREQTGLSTEHTLYSTDEMIKYCVRYRGIPETTEDTEPWFDFSLHGSPECLAEGESCSYLKVPFSNSHYTGFVYDELSGLYSRLYNDYLVLDCKNSAPTLVKNVLVFGTTAYPYPDSDRMHIFFDGGDGYYASEGKIIPIHWSVDERERFVVTDTEGNPIRLNVGKTWICVNRESREPTWE